MFLFKLLLRNAFRPRLRTLLTIVGLVVAVSSFGLLRTLIDEESAGTPRVQNVTLAVRLARHSSYSWEDPALPDDYKDIGELLNVTPETVRQRLGLLPMPAREADGEAALA